MSIYVFVEGETEARVLKAIEEKMQLEMEIGEGRGKHQINRDLVMKLGPILEKGDSIRCLVLRDLDAHTGETVETIVQSVRDTVNRMLQERVPGTPAVTLSPLPDFPSVYALAISRPDFCLALHIATYRWREEFVKATIDDYVLLLAVQPTTAHALIAEKGWQVTADDVLRKVTAEIPDLLTANGIRLQEAKDYVRLYAAVIQEHTSPPVFAQKVIAHVDEGNWKSVFAPLLAAIQFLRS